MTERISPTESAPKTTIPATDNDNPKLKLNINSSLGISSDKDSKNSSLNVRKSSSGEMKAASIDKPNSAGGYTKNNSASGNYRHLAPPLPSQDDNEKELTSPAASEQNVEENNSVDDINLKNANHALTAGISEKSKLGKGAPSAASEASLSVLPPKQHEHSASPAVSCSNKQQESVPPLSSSAKGNQSNSTEASDKSNHSDKLSRQTELSGAESDGYKVKRHSSSGTTRDLVISLLYLFVLVASLFWGANSLLTWKHDLDIQPSISYRQLCWSYNNESLAFIRSENKQMSKGQSLKNSLWISDRFGDGVRCLQDNIPENYELTGWFSDNSLLVLNSPNQPLNLEKFKQPSEQKDRNSHQETNSDKDNIVKLSEAPTPQSEAQATKQNAAAISFAEINCKDNSIKFLNLNIDNIQVVGHNKEEIFLAHYLSSDKDIGKINLMSYKPGSQEAKLVVSIPSRKDEMMHVDSVTASPDNNKLAIVISVIASLSKQVTENDDTPLGVWIFHRDTKTLAWTTIAANNASDLNVVWSKDSKWLGGVARYTDEAEIFAFYGDNDCQAAKLHGLPQEGAIIPLINSDEHALTFISLNRIDRYNFDTQQDKPLLSVDNLEHMPRNFAVSANGMVAYSAKPYNAQNIYICTLNNPNSTVVKIPTDSAKHTWLYRAVGRLQYSLDYWLNGKMANLTL